MFCVQKKERDTLPNDRPHPPQEAYLATSLSAPVNRLSKVLLPTEGKPISPTRAFPVALTSKP